MTWEDRRGPEADIYVQRIGAHGTIASGWPADGAPVCTATGTQTFPSMISDGSGGAFLTWTDYRAQLSNPNVYATRIMSDGTPGPGWAANGLIVSTADGFQVEPAIAQDGVGGVYVVWSDSRAGGFELDLYGCRFTGSGAIEPGWHADGNAICTVLYDQRSSRAIPDGAGGLIVTWSDYRTNTFPDIYAARIGADGVVPVLVDVASIQAEPSRVRIRWYGELPSHVGLTVERARAGGEWRTIGRPVSDGAGYVTFVDTDVHAGNTYGYRLAWTEDGAAHHAGETWVEVPVRPGLQLDRIEPNPSPRPVVSFTLPSADGAWLEVVDLAGRRVWRHEVGSLGAGRHSLPIAPAAPLAAGVYLVRLTQGGVWLTRKAVVAR